MVGPYFYLRYNYSRAITTTMSSGGRKFNEMHTAHRYRDITCAFCGSGFLAYGQRKICDACKEAKARTPAERQKAEAQRAVVRAVAAGKLIRQPCSQCLAIGHEQTRASHGHHEDYSKPLEVIWLCSFHHIKRHEEIKAGVPLSKSRWLEIEVTQ